MSSYYSNDLLGNLWTMDGTSKNQLSYEDTTGFGALSAGSIGGQPFGFGGGNGCETDADTGLVLMGHRYYDTRIGRFISQDSAHSGNNWYSYAANNPVNKIDPDGLTPQDGPGSSASGSPGYNNIAEGGEARAEYDMNYNSFIGWAIAQQALYDAPTKSVTLTAFKPLAPGHVTNNSYYAVPILFDGRAIAGESDPHYILWLPSGYQSTLFTDIDYVYYGTDSSSAGGFDWRHILAFTFAVVDNASSSNQISITMSSYYPVTYGLPWGWHPAPLSVQQAVSDGYIKKTYSGPTVGLGPIIM